VTKTMSCYDWRAGDFSVLTGGNFATSFGYPATFLGWWEGSPVFEFEQLTEHEGRAVSRLRGESGRVCFQGEWSPRAQCHVGRSELLARERRDFPQGYKEGRVSIIVECRLEPGSILDEVLT
jgi:hypothetical protein